MPQKICEINGCDRTNQARGLCHKHYARWSRHGDPKKERITVLERFERKFYVTPGCWIWTASTVTNGYGKFFVNGKHERAHRVSYKLYVGPIPEGNDHHGVCVLHKCDTPSCVNPDHLFLGTQQDNLSDMKKKGRSIKGAARWNSKLTDGIVRDIRASNEASIILAKKYNVIPRTINGIRGRRAWRHIL